MQIGNDVRIKILNKYICRGKVVNIIGEFAQVEVPVYYGAHNQPTITVEDKVENLLEIPKAPKN